MRRSSLLIAALFPLLLPAARGLERSTVDQYRAHLASLRTLVASCEAQASACDPGAVGKDERVELKGLGAGANVNSFEAHYDWLRNALRSAQDAKEKNRGEELGAAKVRLDEALREASGEDTEKINVTEARQRVDAILGHPEFATVREDSIWQKILAKVAQWLDGFFNGVASFGKRSPWIGPVLEWALIGITLAGLIAWAMRVLQRQRVAVRMETARQIEPWEEAARNWRSLAEEQAARGDWREAVHCLYWASIAVLEGRRFWTPNRSRTPREYVRLLEPGSARRRLLGQQTQGFERAWYGLRDTGRQDYTRALELHEGLRAA